MDPCKDIKIGSPEYLELCRIINRPLEDLPNVPVKESPRAINIGFSGNKQTDFLILQRLSDKDLLSACQVNRSVAEICRTESFWRNRFINNFGTVLGGAGEIQKLKPANRNWKEY